jgi:hypothetical protein
MRLANVISHVVVVFAASLGSCSSHAAMPSLPRYGIFVYSDFCVSPMSGDLGSSRISLHRFWDGDSLVYEYTDGSTHALLAEELTVDVAARTLQFKVRHPNGGTAQLSGQFSKDGQVLILRGILFNDPEKSYKLKRISNFATPVPACK